MNMPPLPPLLRRGRRRPRGDCGPDACAQRRRGGGGSGGGVPDGDAGFPGHRPPVGIAGGRGGDGCAAATAAALSPGLSPGGGSPTFPDLLVVALSNLSWLAIAANRVLRAVKGALAASPAAPSRSRTTCASRGAPDGGPAAGGRQACSAGGAPTVGLSATAGGGGGRPPHWKDARFG